MSEKFKNHTKFNNKQDWFLGRKSLGKPACCSGCLQPGAVKIGDLHLYAKGLFYMEDKDQVIETPLRFACQESACSQ